MSSTGAGPGSGRGSGTSDWIQSPVDEEAEDGLDVASRVIWPPLWLFWPF